MEHIVEVKLRIPKEKNPNFWVRVFSLLKNPKAKIGFTFNQIAFMSAYGFTDKEPADVDEMASNEKISLIAYGAAIEYCRINHKRIFFDAEDIKNGMLMASMKVNEQIGNAMTHARMPEWLESIVDNLPEDKVEGVKKK
ncbi:MAG: hypothetical protein R6U65_03605 [Perlabentimonas sp.]